MKAVLLDALGTLVRLEPPAPRLRKALAARGIRVTVDQAEAGMRAEIAFYRERLGEGRDRAALARLRRECARELRRAMHAEAALDDVQAALLEALHFTPYDDALPALHDLRALGVRRVVVSNWDVSLHGVLARTGLRPALSGAVASAELGVAKPAPGIFRHALAMAGVRAADALHVGDSPVEDVEGALAAGVRPVFLAREGDPPVSGVTTIRSLAELPGLVSMPR